MSRTKIRMCRQSNFTRRNYYQAIMLATNKWDENSEYLARLSPMPLAQRIAMKWVLALIFVPLLGAQLVPTAVAGREQAEAAFHEAQTKFRLAPKDSEAGWQFARRCFDLAEFATNDAERADTASLGVAACRQILERAPKSAPAHYYLALDLGQLARTKSLGALNLVNEMEDHLLAAIASNPRFDYAGPHRSLGMLYRDAPGWPISIGSRSKARLHLEKAVELSREFPENVLVPLESYLKWNDLSEVRANLKTAGEVLEKGRKQFSGPEWAADWKDWQERWEEIKKKAEQSSPVLLPPRMRK